MDEASQVSVSGSRPSWTQLLRRYSFLVAVTVFIVGGQTGTALPSELASLAGVCLSLVACILFVVAWWMRTKGLKSAANGMSISGCCAGLFLVGGIWNASVPVTTEDLLSRTAQREPKPIAVRCEIQSAAVWKPNPNHREADPQSEAWVTTWKIRCAEVKNQTVWQPINSLTTLTTEGRISDLLPGDYVECFGKFREIYPPTNPGAFDFAEYSQREGRFIFLGVDSRSQVQKLSTSWAKPLRRVRAMAVGFCDRVLHRHVQQPHASLAAALVFGQRQQVDWERQQSLMATGTLHMLAISGMHVEIVAGGVLLLCLGLGFSGRTRLICVAIVCLLYAGLADGKPPVLRATILVIMAEATLYFGYRAKLLNLLALAGIGLYLLNAYNIHNVGVHLSFLAVASIGIFVVDPTSTDAKNPFASLSRESWGYLARVAQLFWQYVESMVRLSFWVWLMTCPLVWWHFHVVAPIAILLNVLIAVPLGVSLLSGLLTAVVGAFSPLAALFGALCSSSLSLIVFLIDFGESVPWGHYWLPAPPLWCVVVFYGLSLGWLLLFQERHRGYLGGILTTLIAILVLLFSTDSVARNKSALPGAEDRSVLAITFLDVGHGTSVVVEFPNDRLWLYDAGHLGATERSHEQIASALWWLGRKRVDQLLLSHADSDHYNAALGLLKRFEFQRVVTTPQFAETTDAPAREVLEYVDSNGIELATWDSSSEGDEGGVSWQVLHPSRGVGYSSDNASSLCLQLEYGGKRVLLPGDLDGTGLLSLLKLPDRPCHVLMAPHHGSLTRDPTSILEWCRPDFVVISGNHRATRSEVLRQYAPNSGALAVTFRDGAIRWEVDSDGNAATFHWAQDRWEQIGRDELSEAKQAEF
ncbi:MAG: ComEC/Rec2 family competence protein [Pirellulaceae bacterium]